MLNNDYNKQYERRQRIKRTTLVMGIDIGADFNAIGFMNKDGNILGKLPIVYNSREGFNKFVRVTEDLKAKHGSRMFLSGWSRQATIGERSPILRRTRDMPFGSYEQPR